MKKRMISTLLTAILLCGLFPISAQAAGVEIEAVEILSYESVRNFVNGFAIVGKDTNGDKLSDKFGLIDKNGKEVVPLIYDYITNVSEDMAIVGQDVDHNRSTGRGGIDKYGFVDTKGNLVVPFIYDSVENFSEGLAVVSKNYEYVDDSIYKGAVVTSSKNGFVDKTGKEVIPVIYDSASSFSEGLALVAKNGENGHKDRKSGFIDKAGKEVTPLIYQYASSFHEGLAKIYINDKVGFIDKQGKVVIPATNGGASDFKGGFAVVSNGTLYGIINKQGKLVVPIKYDRIDDFTGRMARVATETDEGRYGWKYGFLDTQGTLAVPIIYGEADEFSEGLARVAIPDERFVEYNQYKDGYINERGEVVIPLKYDSAYSFSDGLALVGKNTSDVVPNSSGIPWAHFDEPPVYAIIDKTGKEVIPFGAYDSYVLTHLNIDPHSSIMVSPFHEGIAIAEKGGKRFILRIKDYSGVAMKPLETQSVITATPTASTVLVNGNNTAFNAYGIEGNNYFKLRDLAYALNGTDKQFDVSWDGAKNAISLTSGKVYTSAGGEMTGKGAGNKTPTPTSAKVHLDGKELHFMAYTIDGNNYFKLRDIGKALDFEIDWDGANNRIVIDTTKGYTEN